MVEPVLHSLREAFVETDPLLHDGRYGLSDEDPKVKLIDDLGRIIRESAVPAVLIGGMAVIFHGYKRTTADVDLLIARREAMTLIRALEASPAFSKIRLERFTHNATGRTVDLCVEGELTSPRHTDKFPSPAEVEQITRDPLPVAGLVDLLALKVKSGRLRDAADFVDLYIIRGLSDEDVGRVKAKIGDPALRVLLDQWHAHALEQIERDKLRRPPQL